MKSEAWNACPYQLGMPARNACPPTKSQSPPYLLRTKHIPLCVLCVLARHLQQFIVNSTLSITTKPQHLNSSAEALSLQGMTLRRFLLPLLAVFIMNLKHRVILRKHILYILSSVVNLTPNLREPHLAVRPQRLQRSPAYIILLRYDNKHKNQQRHNHHLPVEFLSSSCQVPVESIDKLGPM